MADPKFFKKSNELSLKDIASFEIHLVVINLYHFEEEAVNKGLNVNKEIEFIDISKEMVSSKNAILLNWALLDIGGTLCKPRNPNCSECPINTFCNYVNVN